MEAPLSLPIAAALCRELIRIPSVNPDDNPGTPHTGEERCAQWIAEWIRGEFSEAAVSTPEVLPGRPNVIARFPSDAPHKPRLLLAPHTDTVSVAGMTIDPFGAEIMEGRMYGRGASDTKGPMASMLAALHAAKDILPHLSHEIWFAGLAGEEAGQHGAHALAAAEKFDLVIAGEPTELDFVHTHKGSMFLSLTTRGVAVHSAKPEAGRNALYPMADVLRLIRDDLAIWLKSFTHPLLGHSTISAGTLRGGSKTNVVPDFCVSTVDIRLVPGQDAAFEEALFARLRQVCPDLEISVSRALPLYTDPEHPLLQKLNLQGAAAVGAPWFCDAAVFASHGSPAIAMGPGSIAQAHTRDEWIALEDLEKGAAFFEAFLRSLQPA
jgi:acetylornithine deacetylase/succinyl-diaminopimelate desuccinylase-like protein